MCMKMQIMNLLLAATMPVFKVILVTLVGSVLALERFNILPPQAIKYINGVVFYVFNPALIFSNLAKTLTLKTLVTLWFMPLNILITFLIGSALGWLLNHITRPPSHLRGLILGCCSAGNLGNMLLIIIPAICKEKGSPFGDQDICYEYGLAYASLSMAIGAIYLWSYVYNIVRISSAKEIKTVEQNGATGETLKTSFDSCVGTQFPANDSLASGDSDNIDHLTLPFSTTPPKIEHSPLGKLKQQLKTVSKRINLKRLLAPSTIGAIGGFIVGVISPFRKLLIGEAAPLHVIQDSAALLGAGAIPTVALVMGGNLTRGLKGNRVRFSIIIGIITVRYILSPMFGVLIVKGALHFDVIHSDQLYNFVLLYQYTVPPAMNISTITQIFGAGEKECSVIMIWTYALASVSLTVWSLFFMWLIS